MRNADKTKGQLINELVQMRQRVAELEASEVERKQAEEALERQKAYFQQLFDNSPDAIALLDDTDRVVQINRGFETLFGYPGWGST